MNLSDNHGGDNGVHIAENNAFGNVTHQRSDVQERADDEEYARQYQKTWSEEIVTIRGNTQRRKRTRQHDGDGVRRSHV